MTGYVPVFASVFTGSLSGRFPDVLLWLALLALADRNGVVDASPGYIARVTGLPVAAVEEAIARLCAPDAESRSPANEGRRLEPLYDRGFGWRVLNFERYREKARLLSKSRAAVESGREAARKRRERAAGRAPLDATMPAAAPAAAESNGGPVPGTALAPRASDDDVVTVFRHWQEVWEHPKAVLDPKRRRAIVAGLQLYSADELCESIAGYRNSPYHRGMNDRGTVYDEITLFLRDAAHVEAGLQFARQPPSPPPGPMSAVERVRLAGRAAQRRPLAAGDE